MTSINSSLPSTRSPLPVMDAMHSASARTGVDFDYLVDVARVESRFNPTARASTSSARGLFQFTKQTWLATLRRHGAGHGLDWAAGAIGQDGAGRFFVADPALRQQIFDLRDDPAAASSMAAALTADNRTAIEGRLGRSAEPVDLYLAHFLGSAGAVRFLAAWEANPDQPGATMLPEAAAANRSVFYAGDGSMRSLGEIRERFRAKLDEDGGPAALPAGPAAAPGWQLHMARSAGVEGGRAPLPMMDIEPMPQKLSMDFAARTYRRLASLGGAA
ncbi:MULTISPECIES: transglycosylase SLT domain-containing protein [Sphingopyxis]|uniref:Lytic transglycosylase, catalytic n=1 Tax=Sphingopyxis granuli TaxID=267128 RepID=A0AA86GRT3_9SPHN|nr:MULTISPECIES: transglycosylase SLT domain-containing protein [Sphingopyxis]AMG76451.1 Lytic transglycosylase, catalytic [Sphingopyxis granuli]APW73998.1 lytic transglycosylase [Sphingopyxis granuli]AVA15329.1 lytic transglycosylase domain-containing protein [Sphingopyxis sp. MG]